MFYEATLCAWNAMEKVTIPLPFKDMECAVYWLFNETPRRGEYSYVVPVRAQIVFWNRECALCRARAS